MIVPYPPPTTSPKKPTLKSSFLTETKTSKTITSQPRKSHKRACSLNGSGEIPRGLCHTRENSTAGPAVFTGSYCLLTVYARSLCPTVLTLLECLYLKCGPFSPPSPPFATPVPSMADRSTRNPEQMVITQDHSPRTTQPHAAHLGRESCPALLSLSPRARTNAGLWDF